MMLSDDTLDLLALVLSSVTLNVSQSDFEQLAPRLINAKRELLAEIAEREKSSDS